MPDQVTVTIPIRQANGKLLTIRTAMSRQLFEMPDYGVPYLNSILAPYHAQLPDTPAFNPVDEGRANYHVPEVKATQ